MAFAGKTKKRRKLPTPNSILDKRALVEALDQEGISMKKLHLDGFYQLLHRQHYPPLEKFVENYYKNERGEALEPDAVRPIKNRITEKKNKNRIQLPKPFLQFLTRTTDFVTLTSRVQKAMTSIDKSTTKLIVELFDGQVVESVIMRYDKKGSGRASLCVSSQCGCAMGCTFCATGTMGLNGNLAYSEILEQLIHADAILAKEYAERQDQSKKLDLVRNVVFMGMGEPLDNYNNVVEACRAMMDRKRWNFAHGRVTVSTVGLVSQIRKLTRELPEVSLALSLHAPNQEARTRIVPTATRYPIEELVDALDGHMMAYLKRRTGEGFTKEERIKESARRRAMIEYVMLEGETSSLECAHQLGKLCENRQLVVNLIPYNATDVRDKLQCPSDEHMQAFKKIVASYGSFCTIRRTMGADIAGACGQLVKKEEEKAKHVDIEDTAVAVEASTIEQSEENVEGKEHKMEILSNQNAKSKGNNIQSISDRNLEILERMLSIAASTAAVAFVVSTSLMLQRKGKR